MEVDRIAGMGSVGEQANPAWQKAAQRRKKFREEMEEPENAEEAGADEAAEEADDAEAESHLVRDLANPAEPVDASAANDAESGGSFRVVA